MMKRICVKQLLRLTPYLALLIIVLIVGLFGFNVIRGKYTTINPDATYHATMMVQTMMDHPVKDHHFLPIMNYNNELDKNTVWGACIKNKEGNLFYLSFPPAYVFVPYCVFKMFNIEGTISDVQFFSLFINLISLIILFYMLKQLFQKDDPLGFISLFGVAIYAFSAEALNAECEYWAQMLFQPILLLFIIVRLKIQNCIGKQQNYNFYFLLGLYALLSFLLVMTEWSAIPCLSGAFIFEICLLYKNNKILRGKVNLMPVFMLIMGIVFALVLLLAIVHSELDLLTVKEYLVNRHGARSSGTMINLLQTYVISIGHFYWLLLFLLILLPFMTISYIAKEKDGVTFAITVLVFASMENIFVKQHALIYTYDRLKCVLLFALICCILMNIISNSLKSFKNAFILVLVFFFVPTLFFSYENARDSKINSEGRFDYNNMWLVNNQFAHQLDSLMKENNDSNTLYVASGIHRANINLLFKRNLLIEPNEKNIKDLFSQKPDIKTLVYVKIQRVYRDCDLIESITVYNKDNDRINEARINTPSQSQLYTAIAQETLVPGYSNLYKFQNSKCLHLDRSDLSKWYSDASPQVILGKHNSSFFCLVDKNSNVYFGKQIFLSATDGFAEKNTLVPDYIGFATDGNWTNGWGKAERFKNVFYLPALYNSFFPDFFANGKKVLFPDGIERTIENVSYYQPGDHIRVSYSGPLYSSTTHKPTELLELNLSRNTNIK